VAEVEVGAGLQQPLRDGGEAVAAGDREEGGAVR
jgi:hypothetical protein